uniref:F-box domain-containing protein n=1 Tax=Meloidogyne enterolobii TaxID=390850 RepID=A0A6V7VZE9_MELEN|nr:unnamed protein product [Meloidogyne enterolobii]
MFYSLPTEIKLDIFKFFSYKELCSIKQTNLYFSAFVNNFEGELAREKLYYIYINDIDKFEKEPHKLVNPKTIDFDFPLNEQLEEKWKNGLETPIPLYLPNQDLDSNIVDCLSKVCVGKSQPIILQLPTIIKSKEDLKIVYYYLNKLFNCSFNYCYFKNFIFNPELIQLLFGSVPKQIYVRECELFINDYNIKNIFKFTLNNLITETLYIFFPLSKEIIEKSKDDLFKFLINGGDNFEVVQLIFNNSPGIVDDITINVQILYNRLIEYIATCRDYSKMLPFILFIFSNSTCLKLSERAEKVEIKQSGVYKCTKYQVSNIHNPKMKFSFDTEEGIDESTFYVEIRGMKK